MQAKRQQIKQLADKLQTLSQERIKEVEDFIDFLWQRDENHQLTQLAMNASQSTLNNIWDNTDDAEYDRL
jgi:Tfp pilus assembly protein PilN